MTRLSLLTGGRFNAFASQSAETAGRGSWSTDSRNTGNRTPDIDPTWYTNNPVAGDRIVWSPAVP